MAIFEKLQDMKGFDRYASPRWQHVPLNGERYMILRDGAGLTVSSQSTWSATVKEIKKADLPAGKKMPTQSGDRFFEIEGKHWAVTNIQAKRGTSVVTQLEVDVKKKKPLKVCFNFVKDNAGNSTRRVPASAAQWLREINYILEGQINVTCSNDGARWVTVPKNLGTTITTTSTGVGEEAEFYPLGKSTSDINIFLVWRMDITDTAGDEDAFRDGKRIVFEDRAGKQFSETLAHEIGHVLGVSDHYVASRKRELMYGYTDARGVHIPKAHANTMNR